MLRDPRGKTPISGQELTRRTPFVPLPPSQAWPAPPRAARDSGNRANCSAVPSWRTPFARAFPSGNTADQGGGAGWRRLLQRLPEPAAHRAALRRAPEETSGRPAAGIVSGNKEKPMPRRRARTIIPDAAARPCCGREESRCGSPIRASPPASASAAPGPLRLPLPPKLAGAGLLPSRSEASRGAPVFCR